MKYLLDANIITAILKKEAVMTTMDGDNLSRPLEEQA